MSNTFDFDTANDDIKTNRLITIPIIVKYHPGKPDEQKVPADLHQLGNRVERRENGMPKVNANGDFNLTALLEGVSALVNATGVHHVLDCLNHGLDLRLRARTRPADGDSQSAQRKATLVWLTTDAGADHVIGYIKAGTVGRKEEKAYLDKIFDEYKPDITS